MKFSKKIGILFMLGLFMVLCLNAVSGAIFIVNVTSTFASSIGAANATLTNGTRFGPDNISVQINSSLVDPGSHISPFLNCSILFTGIDTANSTAVNLTATGQQTGGNTTGLANSLGNFTIINFTPSLLQDGTYNMNISCDNATNQSSYPVRTQVYIDTDVPNAPTTLTSGILVDSSPVFGAVVADANTTQCLFKFKGATPGSLAKNNSGIVNGTLSSGSSNCTLTVSNAPAGVYCFFVIASDGINETGSSESCVSVDNVATRSLATTLRQYQGTGGTVDISGTGSVGGTRWSNLTRNQKGGVIGIGILLLWVFRKRLGFR